MQQQPIPPEQPITVRLPAHQWNFVLQLMQLGTGMLMQDIQAQCLAASVPAMDAAAKE